MCSLARTLSSPCRYKLRLEGAMNKVTSIKKETTLCLCITCKHAWPTQMGMQDPSPKCPECKSRRTIIDQLFEIPLGDMVFTCKCGNKHYKICRQANDAIYWLCVACGTTSCEEQNVF